MTLTLLEIIERAFVGKTVRFSNIPGGQRWIGDHVVKIEAVEFDIEDDDSFISALVVIDFTLRRLSDGEVLHLYRAPLHMVRVEEVEAANV